MDFSDDDDAEPAMLTEEVAAELNELLTQKQVRHCHSQLAQEGVSGRRSLS